jgi:protein-L-isoaspartate(D-aspartate) O-methyltransferase
MADTHRYRYLVTPDDLAEACRAAGVADARVLDAIRRVPRAEFVPREGRALAYDDVPVPIPHGQVTTQPSLVARMVEALALAPGDAVLEVGTGYGWQTAVLARLAGRVWSVERFVDLAAVARAALTQAGVANAEVVVGDGSSGLPGHAPYEAILVAAAFPRVPPPLADQLADGGRLVQPLGRGGSEEVVLFQKAAGQLERRAFLTGASFVRLYGEHGFAG